MANHKKHDWSGGECPTPQKMRFKTKKLAKDWLKVKRSQVDATKSMHIYKCPCGLFHFTTMPRWKAAIINRIVQRAPLKQMEAFTNLLKKKL